MRLLRLADHATRPLGVALLALALSGCSDFLDVNNNPNAPESAKVDIRLPALETMFIHSAYYGENSLWGAEWTQQFSFNRANRSYSQVHRYELSETDASSLWDYDYSRPGKEAFNMMRDASTDGDAYYRGIAKLFYAWSFELITDLWGPVPYTQAFDPTIREPKYDEQKAIYAGIEKSLDEAITDMSGTVGRKPTTNDLLYGGDMTKWVKLARFVQARTNLRLAYAPGEDKTARANKALTAIAAALASNADDADFIYPGGSGARNPNYTFQDLKGTFVGAEFMIEMLKARNDPRIGILYQPVAYDSVRGTTAYKATTVKYIGHKNGSAPLVDSTLSWIGTAFWGEASTLNVVSYADQKFTEAEARLIVSGAAAADAPYRAGIQANMQKLGVPAAAITAYLAARPSLATVANPLEEIINEKYVANFLKVETWNDWRRTGYPRLPTPVEDARLPGIPQRIRTPGSELSNNATQVKATGIPTGLDGMSTKVWWASLGPR